jgi:hypothetical protein
MRGHEVADATRDLREIVYSAGDGGSGPSTWGQRHIWSAVLDNRGNPARFTMRRAWAVPGDRTTADVLTALRALIERHQALRTCFDIEQRPPMQRVRKQGTLTCPITDTATPWSRGAALRAASELTTSVLGTDGEPPVDFHVLTFDGVPQWVVTGVSHLLVDAEACGIVESELRVATARGGLPATMTVQPLQRARFEQSAEGRSQNTRALRYWQTTLQQSPEWLFPHRADGAWQGRRYPVVQAHLPGLGQLAEQAAQRLRVSAAALCTAAFCKAFAEHSGSASYPLGVTFSNRALSWSRGYVGSLAQHGVIGVRDTHLPLERLARQTWQSLLLGHRFSLYHQDDVFTLIEKTYGRACDWFGPVSNFVNFQYHPAPAGPEHTGGAPEPQAPVFTDLAPQHDSAVRFGLHINSDRRDLTIRMSLDQACIPLDTARAVITHADGSLRSTGL